jgi:cobalt-zinc-cadmium efflux system outer membrane protein
MLQRGYTLIRDVQTAFADLQWAKERAAILTQTALIRKEIQVLSNVRFRLGDISELETLTSRADSAAAMDEYNRAGLDTILFAHRLNTLLGYSPDTTLAYVLSKTDFINQRVSKDEYLRLAFDNQPELQAAALAIKSAGSRLGWERSRVLNFMATLNFQDIDGNGGNKLLPNAFNPGIQMELPLLNRNQGKIARAGAEMEQASFNYVAIRQRISLDVVNAYDRYEQTLKSYQIWNGETLPALQEAVQLSQLAFERGDISYLPVLEAMRQLTSGLLRKAEIEAELRRSVSQLNLSIGKKS